MATQDEQLADWAEKKILRDLEFLMLQASNRGKVTVAGKKLKKWYTRVQKLVDHLVGETDYLVNRNTEDGSLEAMEAARDRWEQQGNEIQLLIDLAKAKAQTHDEWADPNWFARAHYALRWRRSEYNRLSRKISAAKKEHRRKWERRQEQRFIALCRKHLDRETFLSLWREAEES